MHAIVMTLIQSLLLSAVPLDPAPAASAAPADPCDPARFQLGEVRVAAVPRATFLRLPGGLRVRVVEAGAADGEPLLLLHGYSDSSFSFSRVLPMLAERYRVIAVDQRGHGCSDQPDGGYGMDTLADDAVDVLDALGVERATVVGHSMGSLVAQQVAARNPERVRRLVLVGSGPRFSGLRSSEELAGAVNALPDPVPVDFVTEFQTSTFAGELPAPFVEAVIQESLRLPSRVWRGLMAGMLAMEPVAPAIGRTGLPTLIVWGELDEVFGGRTRQEELRRAIPGATFLAYEGTGHAPHWETPRRFVDDLGLFMAATPPDEKGR